MRERHAERGRRRLLPVGDRQRHEATRERERVDGHRAPAHELLDEAVLAARADECVGRRGEERVSVGCERDAALTRAVGRLDDDGVAELRRRRRHLLLRPADDRARLGETGLRQALALPLP